MHYGRPYECEIARMQRLKNEEREKKGLEPIKYKPRVAWNYSGITKASARLLTSVNA